ncbi:Hypothetical predicted protein [Mytilus galloprovincialis]|uniref:Uncharacterized protein n=1 Tax=Mytilus galloprovincialis TaxID=29158 RepID=A0A8B6DHI7_MYTGA|nr:Hypothetical predicted protein [Mytilus galloprovincialis]
MRTSFIYILIIVISRATSQWHRPYQQSWPTHPPQTGLHQQQWNNPSLYWNNQHQQWNPHTGSFHHVAPVTTTAIVPTTEPPDNPPPAKVVVVQAPSNQWQNPGWFSPTHQFQNGWGQSPGHMQQPTTGLNRQIQRQHMTHTLPNRMNNQQLPQWGHRQQQQTQWQQPRPRNNPTWDTSNHQNWYQNTNQPVWQPTTQQTPVHRRPSWPQQGQPNRNNQNNQHPQFSWQPQNHQRPKAVQRVQSQQHRQPPPQRQPQTQQRQPPPQQRQPPTQQRQPPPQSQHMQPQRSHMSVNQNRHQRLPVTPTYHETNGVHQNEPPHGNHQHYNPHEYRSTTTQTPYVEHNALQSPEHPLAKTTTTTHPDIPTERDYYIQSQLGPPETQTSDPSIRVHKHLTNDALNHPPVWPVDPYEHQTTTATYHPNNAHHPGHDPNYDPSSKQKAQTEPYKEQHNHQPHLPYNHEPSQKHTNTVTSSPVQPPQDIRQPPPAQSLKDTGPQLPPGRQDTKSPVFHYRTNRIESTQPPHQQDDIGPPLSAYPPNDLGSQQTHHQHDTRAPLPANPPHAIRPQSAHQQHAIRPPLPDHPLHDVGSQPTHHQHDMRPQSPTHPPHDVGPQPAHQQHETRPPLPTHPPHEVRPQHTHQQHGMGPQSPTYPPHDLRSQPTHHQHGMGPPMSPHPPNDDGLQPTHQQHIIGPPLPTHPPHDVGSHPTHQQHTMRPPFQTHPPHVVGSKPTHQQHDTRPPFQTHPPQLVGSQPTQQHHNLGPPSPMHPPHDTASKFSHNPYETGPPLQPHSPHYIAQPLPPHQSHELGAPLPTQTPQDTQSLFGLPPSPLKHVKTDVIVTPSELKYGVTHPDGSITEEMYTLVASRVQRIVSYTTDFLHIMTSYILFDRNRRTFGMRSKRIRDICYAGMLDQDLVDSYKVVVNKTQQVVYPHIEGVSKVFFYKEEEQILFSDVLREAGHYVAGSCGRDPFIFRVSRINNPDIHVGNKLIPGSACPFGPPYHQDYYSIARCINATCPMSYSCNTHYDVCCPDMPVSTNCYSFSIGQICVKYMPGRRIIVD